MEYLRFLPLSYKQFTAFSGLVAPLPIPAPSRRRCSRTRFGGDGAGGAHGERASVGASAFLHDACAVGDMFGALYADTPNLPRGLRESGGGAAAADK